MKYINELTKALRSSGVKHKDSLSEMLDHYSSQYEELAKTESDNQALMKVLKNIQSTNLKPINKQSMIQKHKYIFLTCAVLILSYASYNAMDTNQEFPQFENHQFVMELNDILDPPYGCPLKTQKISSAFGKQMHPIEKVLRLHKGIDFKADLGTDIFTVENGTVVDTGYDDKCGHFIEIQHDDIYSTRYHHLSNVMVKKNQSITKGTKIGEVGTSGLSTGPHLHYEIIKEGKNVDPKSYLKA